MKFSFKGLFRGKQVHPNQNKMRSTLNDAQRLRAAKRFYNAKRILNDALKSGGLHQEEQRKVRELQRALQNQEHAWMKGKLDNLPLRKHQYPIDPVGPGYTLNKTIKQFAYKPLGSLEQKNRSMFEPDVALFLDVLQRRTKVNGTVDAKQKTLQQAINIFVKNKTTHMDKLTPVLKGAKRRSVWECYMEASEILDDTFDRLSQLATFKGAKRYLRTIDDIRHLMDWQIKRMWIHSPAWLGTGQAVLPYWPLDLEKCTLQDDVRQYIATAVLHFERLTSRNVRTLKPGHRQNNNYNLKTVTLRKALTVHERNEAVRRFDEALKYIRNHVVAMKHAEYLPVSTNISLETLKNLYTLLEIQVQVWLSSPVFQQTRINSPVDLPLYPIDPIGNGWSTKNKINKKYMFAYGPPEALSSNGKHTSFFDPHADRILNNHGFYLNSIAR